MAKEIGALNYPWTIVQGETIDDQYQRQVETNGVTTNVDLTLATVTGAIKSEYTDSTNVAVFTITMIDAVNGIFRVSLPYATSAALPVATLKYEIRAPWASGKVEPFFRGNLFVLAGIAS